MSTLPTIPRAEYQRILIDACEQARLLAEDKATIYLANKDRIHVAYGTFTTEDPQDPAQLCGCPLTEAGYYIEDGRDGDDQPGLYRVQSFYSPFDRAILKALGDSASGHHVFEVTD
jgi:hypothetical protein